jgi:hypothetical protein
MEQVENKNIPVCNLNSNLGSIKSYLDSPNHFSEVYLTNELRCAHNHHQTRIKFHTHPLVLREE